MLQFFVSKNLATDMAMHIQPSSIAVLYPQQWYLQRSIVMRRKCIIAMEAQSRYAMVFCGLTKTEFKNFPETFQERLWREVVSICQLDEDRAVRLSELVLNISEQQHYEVGSDRSVQAHIKDANWTLQYLADRAGALPHSGQACFAVGIHINETPRTIRGNRKHIWPLDVFRESWLGLLERTAQVAM